MARVRRGMDAIEVGFGAWECALEDDEAALKALEGQVLGQMRREGVISVEPFDFRKVVLRGAGEAARVARNVAGKGMAAARPVVAMAARAAPMAVRAGGAAGRTLARGMGAVLRPVLMRLEVAL